MESPRSLFLESGNLALDLLNTRPSGDAGADQLRSPRDLVTWMDESGVRPPTGPADRGPPALRILLTETRRLRDDIAQLVVTHAAGETPPQHVLFAISRVMEASLTSFSLRVDEEGARLVEWEKATSLLAVLSPVARAAAELLISSDSSRIRQCAADTCHRWFVDTSKGGRRKWCSMATCGNRAKAAKHRRAHSAA